MSLNRRGTTRAKALADARPVSPRLGRPVITRPCAGRGAWASPRLGRDPARALSACQDVAVAAKFGVDRLEAGGVVAAHRDAAALLEVRGNQVAAAALRDGGRPLLDDTPSRMAHSRSIRASCSIVSLMLRPSSLAACATARRTGGAHAAALVRSTCRALASIRKASRDSAVTLMAGLGVPEPDGGQLACMDLAVDGRAAHAQALGHLGDRQECLAHAHALSNIDNDTAVRLRVAPLRPGPGGGPVS